jgi:hypothetical protein
MAITNGYTTLAIVKARLTITGTGNDAALESCIEAASREIDGLCGRRFYQLTATTRYFTADDSQYLDIDDLVSVTSLGTDADGDRTFEDTWATTDYDLEPYNAADTGWPYTQILTAPAGRYGFPSGTRRGVKIVGTWGWPSVPSAITEATILQSIRLFKRKDSPYGIAGSPDLGQQTFVPGQVDPQVKSLVAPYRKLTVGAV